MKVLPYGLHRLAGPTGVEIRNLEDDFFDVPLKVIGLYLNPPDRAVVLCCDEKSQCHVPKLLFKLFVVGEFESPGDMRLDLIRMPDSLDGGLGDAHASTTGNDGAVAESPG